MPARLELEQIGNQVYFINLTSTPKLTDDKCSPQCSYDASIQFDQEDHKIGLFLQLSKCPNSKPLWIIGLTIGLLVLVALTLATFVGLYLHRKRRWRNLWREGTPYSKL